MDKSWAPNVGLGRPSDPRCQGGSGGPSSLPPQAVGVTLPKWANLTMIPFSVLIQSPTIPDELLHESKESGLQNAKLHSLR